MIQLLLTMLFVFYGEGIAIVDGEVYCNYAYATVEAIIYLPEQKTTVLCGKQTSAEDGMYYSYYIVASNLIAGTDDHPQCGERAWNDLYRVILPSLINDGGDKKFQPLLDLMKSDMHEACHKYWLDQTGW